MRLDLVFRGIATAVIAPGLLVAWLLKGNQEASGHADVVATPSSPSSLVLSERQVLRTTDTRELGLRLLALSEPNQVRAGLSSLTTSAGQGDAEAQVALGRIFLQGIVAVPKDAG